MPYKDIEKRNAYQRQYRKTRQKNEPEYVLKTFQYHKNYREKNIEVIKRNNKLNLPKRRERERKRKQKDLEYYQKYLRYQKKYRSKNKEKLKRKSREKWIRKNEQYTKQKREHYIDDRNNILTRNKKYRQTDNGRIACAKHHHKRRNLGTIELFPNILNETENPTAHHVDLSKKYYVWIPRDLHLHYLYGKYDWKHIENLLPIVEQLYPEIDTKIKRDG